jgi:hypothetical protein
VNEFLGKGRDFQLRQDEVTFGSYDACSDTCYLEQLLGVTGMLCSLSVENSALKPCVFRCELIYQVGCNEMTRVNDKCLNFIQCWQLRHHRTIVIILPVVKSKPGDAYNPCDNF